MLSLDSVVAAALVVWVGSALPMAESSAIPTGAEVAKRVNARDEGDRVSRRIEMELIHRRGQVRRRTTRSFRVDADEARKTALYFVGPASVRGTAFLTVDYDSTDRDDDQWLYLPSVRRVRRISAADRGSYFLGTDFTYDDIRTGGRVTVQDFEWSLEGRQEFDGRALWRLAGDPVSPEVAAELGYGRALFWVDDEIWMVRRAEFWDTNENHLKTISFREIEEIQGIWTTLRIEAENHKTGHRTRFLISEVDYESEIPESTFTQEALRRRLR